METKIKVKEQPFHCCLHVTDTVRSSTMNTTHSCKFETYLGLLRVVFGKGTLFVLKTHRLEEK